MATNPYGLVMAFQHFAGKPLKALDAFDCLSDEEQAVMRENLLRVAARLRHEDIKAWAELHALSVNIEEALKK